MSKLKKIDHYIADLEHMLLVNTEKGLLYKFDFQDMTVQKVTPQSKPISPIRYDEIDQKLKVWRNESWQSLPDGQEAALFMFNHRIESLLLR